MEQTTIFDMLYPKYKITKPIRLIELFGGYGSQALALKYLGVEFEHWKLCEWAIKSIQAYKDIHFTDENIDYSKTLNKDQLQEFLFNKGISSNYNEPMTSEQINRLNEDNLRTIYNNIQITHNLVNIQQVKGQDLEIVDKDKYEYIMTYSFPCQDLSLAGKGKGMSDTSTRSGMLWEAERILTECKKLESLPQILLMENVPQVHGTDNVQDFNKWQLRLEELGYKNYFQDLIATDYEIPQTRNRCFMVSILGDYNYTFPKPIPLKLKLKDMLEDNVDEKYYLSDKTLEQISNWESYQNPLDNVMGKESISPTITTRIAESQDGGINASMKVYCNNLDKTTDLKKYYLSNKMIDYITSKDGKYKVNENKLVINRDLACSKTTREGNTRADTSDYICKELPENTNILRIKNATKQGYLEATDGDEIDLTQPNSETRRGRVQKEAIQTLTTQNNLGVCVGTYQYSKSDNFMKGKDRLQLGKETSDTLQTTPKEGVVTLGNYSPSNHNASRIVDKEHCSPTVMENHGTVTATQTNDLRIRKLTPKECFRLMGVKDEDFEKCAKNQSDSSLYHLAGDSIVVNVLMAIFKELL